MGQFDQDFTTEVFTLSTLFTGKDISDEEVRKHKFKIITFIKDSKLIIALEYYNNQFKENTILNLLDNYLKNIKKLIDT